MRILVDLQACQNGSRHRGIGRYAMAMTKALIRLDRGHDWRILLSDRFPGTIATVREALEGVLPQEHILVCALPGRTASAEPANAWRTRAAEMVRARFVAATEPDLVFVPSLFEGFWDETVISVEPAPFPTAVTLFDFIPLEYPDHYLPGIGIKTAYHRKLANARPAGLLLPISEFVAGEAIGRLGLHAERIVATPLGVEPHFKPAALDPPARAALMTRYGIDRPFVLNTSPLEFRKNIEGLIAGFGHIRRPLRDAHQLVIVGRMNPAEQRTVLGMARQARLPEGAVVFAGFVSDEDLIALYGACALFAFPSISEGFGLPVLEAMACGAPVIGSATTSIPEVIGRADLLCDPLDPASIGAAMARVLADPALQAALRTYGIARAAGFSWERATTTAMDAFERLHAAHRPAPPAPPPPGPARPRLALVAKTVAIERGALPLDALAARFDITLVCPEGMIEDVPIMARFDVRDFAWFDRHAPRFDAIVYAYVPAIEADLAPMMAAYPGILLDDGAPAPGDDPLPAPSLRDLFAAGGFPLLIAAAGGAIGPSEIASHAGQALRSLAIATIAPIDATGTERLCETILGIVDLAGPDPRRALAAALPAAVRDVRPAGDDLARLAVAVARNAAHDRAPVLAIDITALDPADRAALGLLRATLAGGDASVTTIRAEGGRFVRADADAARLLDLGTLATGAEHMAFRPDDRILGFTRLGSFAPPTFAALRDAVDCGTALSLVVENEDAAEAAARDGLQWAAARSPSSRTHLRVMPALGKERLIDAADIAALIAVVPVDMLLPAGALAATLRCIDGVIELTD